MTTTEWERDVKLSIEKRFLWPTIASGLNCCQLFENFLDSKKNIQTVSESDIARARSETL